MLKHISTIFFRQIGCMLLLAAGIPLMAQPKTDTLNTYNEKHQKQGYWIVYLTDKLVPTKDTLQARFYAYNYYDAGVEVGFFPMANTYRKKAKKVVYMGVQPVKGKIQVLNGEVVFYDKDTVAMVERYVNGIPLLREGFFFRNRQVRYKQILDYSKEFRHEPGSFYYEYSDSKETIEKLWYRKKTKRWRLHYDLKNTTDDYDKDLVRYDIEALDRDGKGSSFLHTLRKHLKLRIDLCYQGTFIHDKLLSGLNINGFTVIRHTFGIGYCYAFSQGPSSKSYGYSNVNAISVFENSTTFHYFFFYSNAIKSSVYLNLGSNNVDLGYKKPNGERTDVANKYFGIKPGVWNTFNIKGVQINTQLFYRIVAAGRSKFGQRSDFNGPGFCIGFSFR